MIIDNRHLLTTLFVVLTSAARAQTVELQLEREAIYGAEEIDLYVRISGRANALGAPDLKSVDGLLIRGPSTPSQRTQIVNGRFSHEIVYRYLVTPRSGEPREYVIGPATVSRRGQASLKSNQVTLKVFRRPQQGLIFRREISRTSGAILSPFVITYTVYYSGQRADEVSGRDPFGMLEPFGNRSNPFGLTRLELPLLKRPEVKLFPRQVRAGRDGTTVTLQNDHQIIIQEGSAELDGFGYQTLVFGFQVVPLRAGPLEIAPAEVAMKLVTGMEDRWQRDFFTRRKVRQPVFRTFSGMTETITYNVQNPPPQGRPVSYNGAVGKYSIEVTASPTEVDAFTPIKLEARVRCESRWREDLKKAILENLSPPRWSREESLTKDFGVSSDLHPGVVEGDAKVFTQTIRPLGEYVKEVPPIPFPYYDPDAGQYRVAYSRPIPLTVRAVNTVNAGDAIRNPGTRSPDVVEPSNGSTPVVSIVEQSGIAANFQTIGEVQISLDPRAEIVSVRFLCFLVAPPLAFGLAVFGRRCRRDPSRVRKDRALKRATNRLTSADSTAEEAAAAFQDYFRERLSLASGELTPGDLSVALAERDVPEKLQSAATALLERFLSARFGGGESGARELAQEAHQLLRELDPCLR